MLICPDKLQIKHSEKGFKWQFFSYLGFNCLIFAGMWYGKLPGDLERSTHLCLSAQALMHYAICGGQVDRISQSMRVSWALGKALQKSRASFYHKFQWQRGSARASKARFYENDTWGYGTVELSLALTELLCGEFISLWLCTGVPYSQLHHSPMSSASASRQTV